MGSFKESTKWPIWSKYYLYVFNVTSLILALGIMGLALFVRFDWTFKHYVLELGAQGQIWTGPYILMAASGMTILMAFFGCWATAHENPFQLLVFTVVTGIAAILGLAGSAYSLDHGTQKSKLTPWMEDRFTYLQYDGVRNERSARIVRIMEEELGCCGGTGWLSYADMNMEVPTTCRNPVTGIMYVYGCGIIYSDYVELYLGWLAGLGLFLVVLQIFAVMVGCHLRWAIKRLIKKEGKSYFPVKTNV